MLVDVYVDWPVMKHRMRVNVVGILSFHDCEKRFN